MKIEDLYGRKFKTQFLDTIYQIKREDEFSISTNWDAFKIYYPNEVAISFIKCGTWILLPYEPKFKHLEEIEVSDDEEKWDKGKFIGISYDNYFVVEDRVGYFESYIHARKINHEKNEAILQIKKLMIDKDIKIEEL